VHWEDEKLCLIVRIELAVRDYAQQLFFHESIGLKNEDGVLSGEACDHVLRKMEAYWISPFVNVSTTLHFPISQQCRMLRSEWISSEVLDFLCELALEWGIPPPPLQGVRLLSENAPLHGLRSGQLRRTFASEWAQK
jgi:hypothetical protein